MNSYCVADTVLHLLLRSGKPVLGYAVVHGLVGMDRYKMSTGGYFHVRIGGI